MNVLNVAIIQLDANCDKKRNVTQALQLCETAVKQGAQLISLPEMFNQRSSQACDQLEGETIPGPSLQPFLKLAQTHRVWIHAGSIAELSKEHTPKCFNTTVVINPEGNIHSTYRKIHLFDADLGDTKILESQRFVAGDAPTVCEIAGFKAGLSICFDLRFSNLFEWYARAGVDMVFVPASFTKPTGELHWEVLLRARAIESQAFIIASNQTGIGASGVPTYGNSMIIAPSGEILARASNDKTEILFYGIDLDMIKTVRHRLPMKDLRKGLPNELY